jgi:hypothetical protein
MADPVDEHIAEVARTRLAEHLRAAPEPHSTVTLLARLRGLSTSVPRAQAV